MQKTFDPNDMNSKISFILDHIDNYIQVSLSTVDEKGKPWTVCVNKVLDDEFTLFWKSNKNANHSTHLQTNPHASILMYGVHGEYDFAFYSKWVVSVVEERDQLEKVIEI